MSKFTQQNPKVLYLLNSATRARERFEAIDPQHIKLYTCGPTVYNYAYIGNLRTYVFEDVLVRALRYAGYQIEHVKYE